MLPGGTPAESKRNFVQWLDVLISNMTSLNPLVTTTNGDRVPGLYHQIRQPEFFQIMSVLQGAFAAWGNDCKNNNLSMGQVFYATGDGAGKLTITHHVTFPFN